MRKILIMNRVNKEFERKRKLLEMKRMMLVEQQERGKGQNDLLIFSQRVYPGYVIGKHHRYIAKIFEKAMRREIGWTRLVIHEPPQHGKSLQGSILFPAFYMGHFPDDPIILTAYNDEHAIGFSKKIKSIIDSEPYSQIFPGMELSEDTRAGKRWDLKAPHRGSLVAAGLGGGITGKGAKLLIMDDPVKNRREVEQPAFREQQKEDYRSTLKTRLHNDAIQLLQMTRWHEDDLANYLIREHGFRYICLPAISGANDPLGRREGDALWGERFPLSLLTEIKETSGSYNWSSMYQGEPAPPEGLLFKKNQFPTIDRAPNGLHWVRAWDLATSERTSADFTASFKIAADVDGRVYIDSGIRGQWDWTKVRKLIKITALTEKNVFVGIEAQGVQRGMIQECWSDLDLISVGIFGIPVPDSKRVRALPVMARAEAGKLYLIKGPWNEAFIDEFIHFDVGEHDDQVDAISLGFHMLALSNPGIVNLNDYDIKQSQEQIVDDGWFSTVNDEEDFQNERVHSFTFTE